MMTMPVRMHLHFLDSHHASVRNLAIHILKLNRRVSNVKARMQRRLDLLQNTIALRRRNIGNRHMAGQRVRLRSQAPDVQIMHILNACDPCSVSRISGSEIPRGVPSSRIFSVSRTIESDDQIISAAIARESTGSIQDCPVHKIAAPPTITAAVESVSPSM